MARTSPSARGAGRSASGFLAHGQQFLHHSIGRAFTRSIGHGQRASAPKQLLGRPELLVRQQLLCLFQQKLSELAMVLRSFLLRLRSRRQALVFTKQGFDSLGRVVVVCVGSRNLLGLSDKALRFRNVPRRQSHPRRDQQRLNRLSGAWRWAVRIATQCLARLVARGRCGGRSRFTQSGQRPPSSLGRVFEPSHERLFRAPCLLGFVD